MSLKPQMPVLLEGVTTEYIDENGVICRKFTENAIISEAIYLRNPITLYGFGSGNFATVQWITISQVSVSMRNVSFKGLIQVTARGKLEAINCRFKPGSANVECAIEIFAQSELIFKDCELSDSRKAALLIRDRSKGVISNCTFMNNGHSSLLILDGSSAIVEGSRFPGTDQTRFSVYVYRQSSATFNGCSFNQDQGKSVFVLSSTADFSGCKFNNCIGGAISIADKSKTSVRDCIFSHIKLSSIHGMKECNLEVFNSQFDDCEGNGVNFENSVGIVKDCKFSNFKYPAFAVFGDDSNPVIQDCQIDQCNTFAAVSRDSSRPLFSNIKISNGAVNGFSISDFSSPVIQNCTIENIKGYAFSAYNGATPTILGNTIIKCNQICDVFTQAMLTLKDNTFINDGEEMLPFVAHIHHLGVLEIQNNVIQLNGNIIPVEIKDGTFVLSDKTINSKSHIMEHSPLSFLNVDEALNRIHQMSNEQPSKCMCCKSKNPSRTIVPCGHCIICDNCTGSCKQCPLCQTNVQQTVPIYKSERCVVCFEQCDTTILPCGHQAVCYRCAIRLWKEGRKCPECREKMISFRYNFPIVDDKSCG